MSSLKVGTIGGGNRGSAHARAYETIEDVQLVACADPVREAAEALAAEQWMPVCSTYTDYQEMLMREQPRYHVVSIDSSRGAFHVDELTRARTADSP